MKPTKDYLTDLRVIQKKSVKEIYQITNASSISLVKKWLRDYEITITQTNDDFPATLTEQQIHALIGSLLGDGHLTRCGEYGCKNSAFQKSQSVKRQLYLKTLFELMKPYSTQISEREVKSASYKDRITKQHNMLTVRHPIFTNVRQEWYPDGIKIVPANLVLNPEIVAWWFCDDGCNHWKYNEALFSSQSFTKEENEFLVDQLVKLGIKGKISPAACHKDRNDKGGWNVCVNSDNYFKLMNMIRPYVVQWGDDIAYKVDTHGGNVGMQRNNTSGYRHISECKDRDRKQKWHVRINKKFIGRFVDIEDAIKARDAALLNKSMNRQGPC